MTSQLRTPQSWPARSQVGGTVFLHGSTAKPARSLPVLPDSRNVLGRRKMRLALPHTMFAWWGGRKPEVHAETKRETQATLTTPSPRLRVVQCHQHSSIVFWQDLTSTLTTPIQYQRASLPVKRILGHLHLEEKPSRPQGTASPGSPQPSSTTFMPINRARWCTLCMWSP